MDIADFIKENTDYDIKKYEDGKRAAIYFICEEDGLILYIGSSLEPYVRFKTHYLTIDFCNKPIFFFWIPIDNCKKLEEKLIKQIKPKYNIQWNCESEHIERQCRRPPKKRPQKQRPPKQQPKSTRPERLKATKIVRKQLLNYMKKNKVSQTKIAETLRVSRQNISQLINNDTIFSKATIRKIERILNLPACEVLKNRKKY